MSCTPHLVVGRNGMLIRIHAPSLARRLPRGRWAQGFGREEYGLDGCAASGRQRVVDRYCEGGWASMRAWARGGGGEVRAGRKGSCVARSFCGREGGEGRQEGRTQETGWEKRGVEAMGASGAVRAGGAIRRRPGRSAQSRARGRSGRRCPAGLCKSATSRTSDRQPPLSGRSAKKAERTHW